MENVNEKSDLFLSEVLYEIWKADKLHFKTLSTEFMASPQFGYVCNLIYNYFASNKIDPDEVAEDYLWMIGDMRRETAYFMKHGDYSCKSEQMAYERVYGNPGRMAAYMNALMISQILWGHHFKMLMYFSSEISKYYLDTDAICILDIGSGHALYPLAVIDYVPHYQKINVIDLSDSSLRMASQMLTDTGFECIKADVMDYMPEREYDLIIMGEILEHTINPSKVLRHVSNFLTDKGLLWLTVPTNAPAIDHIYLFRTEKDVCDMIESAGLRITEKTCIDVKNTQTQLIGAFCIKK